MILFDVTYEIVTPESTEHGDAAERGFVERKVCFRHAIESVRMTRTSRCGGVECIEPSESGHEFRWITVYNGTEYETGAHESRSLHIPDCVTDASRVRIARLLGCRLL
jgi:hypothetical protein